MSLYHDYLRDTAVKTDQPKGVYKSREPVLVFRPLTPCFEEIAVQRCHKHIDRDFAGYLRHALRHLSGERHQNDYKHRDFELDELAQVDIIAASIKICMLEAETSADYKFTTRAGEDAFITLLIACVDGDMADVKILNEILETLSGISALTTPLLLQILVAVALSHYNNTLVVDLVTWSPPPRRNLFNLKPRREGPCGTWLWIHWLYSGKTGAKPLGVWETLLRAEWVAPCGDMMQFVYRAQNNAEESAHAIYIFNRVLKSKAGLPSGHLNTIEQTVKMGPPAVVTHMLTRLAHRNIRPRPHFLLQDAASRSRIDRLVGAIPPDVEMLEALRPMHLDINSIVDPRGKAKGVSPLEQTPLHTATSQGNIPIIEWCLKNGARPTKDRYGRYQWEKVEGRNRDEVLALYKAHCWEIDSKTWLSEHEGKNKCSDETYVPPPGAPLICAG
ncbi:hypothetical protein GQX73_g3751 [Xylaria multiplex]|uniref:Uncharacterized protein n=1 Tax=Xylaria multiplex TaxID=323545 RepID=A0A7C8IS61_9PEZI|nr:hypothetical protein GQX73_g3751 [Xylaria multiplex]